MLRDLTPASRHPNVQGRLVGRNWRVLVAQSRMKWSWQRHIKLLAGLGMVNCNHLPAPCNKSGAARRKGIHIPREQGNALIHFLVVIKVPPQIAKGTRMLWEL